MNRLISIATIAVALVAAPAYAQEPNDQLTANFSDTSRPGLLKVNLFNGSLSIRTHSGNDVIIEGRPVAARRRNPPTTADGLRRIDTNGLTVEEENNVMTVSSPGPFGGGNLDIQVPGKTNLSLRTVNGGSVVVDGVEGEIEVTNVNGNVMLNNVSGSVIAHATNGKLTAVLQRLAPDKPMSFTSMNANVDVTLPATAKANLKIRTDNGAAYSDFDIQRAPSAVEEERDGGGRLRIRTNRTINGTINGGGPDFEIRTLNGNIYLRKAK